MQTAQFSFKFKKYLALVIVPLFMSIFFISLQANENTIKNEEYYYETHLELIGEICFQMVTETLRDQSFLSI